MWVRKENGRLLETSDFTDTIAMDHLSGGSGTNGAGF